ncbi:hypothetical protein MIND_00739200 [Mycena indigotica]|uniref:Alpha/beta-hydrolase n=1 Tax=Mycena indigotica TaxID=2126181 RepID=A0A8H6SN72_9AGAR|nr:uncharacterized protein MIND_00739200 [Mycena indigotica]KAF7301736.1 hypothetical protein MIND_00739200 [Mycena indigotica]
MALTIDEEPDVPKPTERSYYIVALFLLPFQLVSAISWACLAYSLVWGNVWSWKFALAACEAIFSVYHWHLSRLASQPWRHGTGSLAQLQLSYNRVLQCGLANLPEDGSESHRPASPTYPITQLEWDDPRAVDFRHTLRTWFNRVPFSAIRRFEVRQWLYWSIFAKDLPETMPPGHQAIIDDSLRRLEMRVGGKIPEGSNPNAPPMRVTLDEVQISTRPLFLYALIFAVNWCLQKYYGIRYGLKYGSYQDLEYLLYIPNGWDINTGPQPTIFFHGLGLGLLQYHPLLMDLRHHFKDRPLLFPLQPHISQNIFHSKFLDPPSRRDLADLFAGLLHQLGWVDLSSTDEDLSRDASRSRTVTVLSHSNGSYMHTWCVKAYPELISRSCFVDPVSLCLWEGDLPHNFLYQPPTHGVGLIVRYFVGRELGTAAQLYRNFDWSSNELWFEDIPNAQDPTKTFFLLGGNDAIVNSPRVRKYLSSHGVHKGLWYDEMAQHGDALLRGTKGHAMVLDWLKHNY